MRERASAALPRSMRRDVLTAAASGSPGESFKTAVQGGEGGEETCESEEAHQLSHIASLTFISCFQRSLCLAIS